MKAWSPPGRFRAACGPQAAARKAPHGSWGRPGEPKQIIGWTPAPPRGEKLIDFRVPGGSWRLRGGLRGVILGVCLGHAAWGGKKPHRSNKATLIFILVEFFLSCLFSLSRRRRHSAPLQIRKSIGVFEEIGLGAFFCTPPKNKKYGRNSTRITKPKNNEKRTHEQHKEKHRKNVKQ